MTKKHRVPKEKKKRDSGSKLTANLRRRHDLPTPESPISKSLNK